MYIKYLLVFLILQQELHSRFAGAKECLRPANAQGVIPSGPVEVIDRADTSLNRRQVIVTSYRFQCCGTITRWQTYVSPSGSNHRDGVYSIFFQVWRTSTPGANDGCNVMVGEDRYNNILLSDEEDVRGLVNRTVPQPSNLTVQPGDMVGFVVLTTDTNEGSIQLSENVGMGFDEEVAYYNSGDLMFNSAEFCPFPIGAGRILDASIHAAPALSLDIDQIPCPTTSSSQDTPAITSDDEHASTLTTDVPTLSSADVNVTIISVIVGILLGIIIVVVLLITILVWKYCYKTKADRSSTSATTDQGSNEQGIQPDLQKTLQASNLTSNEEDGDELQHYYSSVGALENTDVIYTELKDATDSKPTDALVTENITVTLNECYSTNIHLKVNECYGTVTDDIPLEANESYTTTQMRVNECNGAVANDIPLEVNENKCNSVTADDIPLEVNESYITNTSIRANEFQNATANNVPLEANNSYQAIGKLEDEEECDYI